jgi:carboxypeptidase Q
MCRHTAMLVLLGACARVAAPAASPPLVAAPPPPELAAYGETAARIVAAALADDGAYRKLAHLTDHIGARLAGSPALERAVAWGVETFRAEGHDNVRAEKAMVPVWIRGAESAAIVSPVERPIAILALGGSSATPPEGIEAPVVVVADWPAFEALGDGARGKIVLFNWKMPPYGPQGSGYGEAAKFRVDGPQKAAARGAVAALIRSVTAHSLGTPHTGATKLDRPFPAAAVSVEDAELLARLVAAGEVRVRLKLGNRTLPDAPSANVVAEIVGRERPEEIVVIGGHLDSWDVGQGAHDDGAGVVMTMQAMTVLRKLGLHPRRTIRAVLFTNEENGQKGADAYAAAHAGERHVAALESDSGGFRPVGFGVKGGDARFAERVRAAAAMCATIGPIKVEVGSGGGTDIKPLADKGVPVIGLQVEGSKYFDYHHSAADTLDKVDPKELAMDVAAVAVVAFVLADAP